MKLFLDFELCEECNSFIADLTREDSLLLDDIARNEISTKVYATPYIQPSRSNTSYN